jgi:hypothetical protein
VTQAVQKNNEFLTLRHKTDFFHKAQLGNGHTRLDVRDLIQDLVDFLLDGLFHFYPPKGVLN